MASDPLMSGTGAKRRGIKGNKEEMNNRKVEIGNEESNGTKEKEERRNKGKNERK
jgi:hypothetical protein